MEAVVAPSVIALLGDTLVSHDDARVPVSVLQSPSTWCPRASSPLTQHAAPRAFRVLAPLVAPSPP